MKKFITITLLFIFTIYINRKSNAQCPAPACTQTAVSGTNYTVNASDVLCISSNYSSGTITINGGTVLVQSGGNLNSAVTMSTGTINVSSGGTLTRDILPTTSATLNVCGTISGTRQINDKATLNYYGTANYTMDLRNGAIINNYSTTANVSFNNMDNTNTKTFNNYGTVPALSMTQFNQPITINNIGGTLTVSASPTIKAGTILNNSGGGTFNWTPSMIADAGTLINNAAGSTMNFTTGGTANKPSITNNGTMNFSGQYYLAGGTSNNNGTMNFANELRLDGGTLNINANSTVNVNSLYKNNGTINMDNHSLLNIATNITTWNGTPINLVSGCASIMGSTTASSSAINNPFLSNMNLNFCGAAPMNGGGCITTLTSVSNNGSNAYRITGNFSCGSGLSNLQYINIIGATGVTNLNGYWQVTKINATTFDLIGSTFTTGAVFGSTSVQFDQSKLMLGPSTYLGYSGCTNPCAPLPIKLLSFTATKDNGSVKIAWQTIEEKNNDYYVIERSTDGVHFETVTTVRGNRNSSSLLTYDQYDYSPYPGTSYYRLKQVDLDGSFSYSSIAAVEFDSQSDWIVFPNPSKDGSFTIASSFAENEVVTVTVTDVTGNRVRYYDNSLYAQEMQVSDLASGLYIVSIQTVTQILSKKLVVQ
ncbi:T9SS type A sorting domain-containing protein [Cytophaga aurantiaca]|uniref:T9SS type A sorting domain-containing protein n=1 Tax=Cytophaga aurantiaca TaxID=29530 RepID=UPI000372588E|nr:T9SS type A sorting domain-containing protein [Cytophaga aurantiaca]